MPHRRGAGSRTRSPGGGQARGRGCPRRWAGRLEAELAADAAQQVLGVDAELLQLVGVLLGIDGVGELGGGLLDLVLGALVAQDVEDLVLGNFHWQRLLGAGVGGERDAAVAAVRRTTRARDARRPARSR